MSKERKDALDVKATYVRPMITCLAVNASICAGSPFDSDHSPGEPGGSIDDYGSGSYARKAEWDEEWDEELNGMP